MALADSPLNLTAVKRARALLRPAPARDSPIAVLAAAAFFAFTSLALAVVVISVPPVIDGK